MIDLPHDLHWNADLVLRHIVDRGLVSKSDGDDVVVLLPDDRGSSIVDRLSRWLNPPLSITVSHNCSRFIRNVDLSYDPLRMPDDFPCFHEIHSALSDFGCMTLCERDVALHYFPESSDIPKFFDELEWIQLEKEELVRQQDFEAAARARDDGELLRNHIDDILRRHLGISTGEREYG